MRAYFSGRSPGNGSKTGSSQRSKALPPSHAGIPTQPANDGTHGKNHQRDIVMRFLDDS